MSEDLRSIMERRHSCRVYTGKQITEEELKQILEAGNAAPIAMNQCDAIRITVVQDSKLLHEIENCGRTLYQKMNMKRSVLYGAPTLILIAVRKAEENAFLQARICSAACMLSYMQLQATELNIGNVYLTGVTTALNQQ